jgi:hypothetical protein
MLFSRRYTKHKHDKPNAFDDGLTAQAHEQRIAIGARKERRPVRGEQREHGLLDVADAHRFTQRRSRLYRRFEIRDNW